MIRSILTSLLPSARRFAAGGGFILASVVACAQSYDWLLKGGHVIDSRNGINAVMDVAIAGGKVAEVGANLPAERAARVIDVTGLYVAPGLIDLHVHAFFGTDPHAGWGGGFSSLPPDGFTLRAGVTTAVDAGSAGWRNFLEFKGNVIDRSQTRILAFLNVVGHGMQGHPIEQDLTDMNPRLAAMRARQFPDHIVGIKTAHYRFPDWGAVESALEAGRLADLPIMVDYGFFLPERPFEELVTSRLRPGDIYTHAYHQAVPMLDSDRNLRSYLLDAQARGVLFDVGHGGGSFVFSQAVPATQQGFWPDTISTDLHAFSAVQGMKDMANVMSKFLNLGMPLHEVVHRSTWAPAQVIRRPALGHLSAGADADVVVFKVHTGKFGYTDVVRARFDGDRKIECELTFRDGNVVWDLNGLASLHWEELPSR